MTRPHEDPNCRCKACEAYAHRRLDLSGWRLNPATCEFEQRMFAAWQEERRKGRRPDAVFVNPKYARECGVPEHTEFGGVAVIYDVNVCGQDIHPFESMQKTLLEFLKVFPL